MATDQRKCDRIEPPRPWPSLRIAEDALRIDRRQSLHQCPPGILMRVAFVPRRRDLAHETVQADAVGRDRRLALVRDRLAVDQRKGAQRRHRFVEAVIGERRGQRLAELLAPSENRKSGIGSGASSAAWTISGSAAGWSFAASSMASAKVFATVRPS